MVALDDADNAAGAQAATAKPPDLDFSGPAR